MQSIIAMQTAWDAGKSLVSLVKMVCFKKKENLNFVIQYFFIQFNFAPVSYCRTFDTSWKLKKKAIIFFQINLEMTDILMGFVVVCHGGNIILRQYQLF